MEKIDKTRKIDVQSKEQSKAKRRKIENTTSPYSLPFALLPVTIFIRYSSLLIMLHYKHTLTQCEEDGNDLLSK